MGGISMGSISMHCGSRAHTIDLEHEHLGPEPYYLSNMSSNVTFRIMPSLPFLGTFLYTSIIAMVAWLDPNHARPSLSALTYNHHVSIP